MPVKKSFRDEQSAAGFVLVAVLGALLLLSIMAVSLTVSARNDILSRSALDAHARLRLQADGYARVVASRLARQQSTVLQPTALPVDGRLIGCVDTDTRVAVRVTDVNGLIDLNAAPVPVLQILLSGLEVPTDRASAMAQAIAVFRAATAPGAANAASFGSAALSKQAPFDVVDELEQIQGMTPELLAVLRPLVTTYSRSPSLDTAVAPIALLQALTWGQFGYNTTLAAREQFRPPLQLNARPVTRATNTGRSRVAIYHIEVTTSDAKQRRATRHAVVELSTRADTGFVVREWSSRASASAATNAQRIEAVSCAQVL